MQAGIVTLVEFLKQTGFVEGFRHGAVRRGVHDILDSETMDRVLDRVIQTINRNRGQHNQLARITKESTRLFAKLALEYPIQVEKFNRSDANTGTRAVDLVISDTLITEAAATLSCSNEAAEFVAKVFFQALHDQHMLNKPLYSIGNSIGDYSISFSRGIVNDTFSYKDEEPTCCSNFMNTITCGCWGSFFKQPAAPHYANIGVIEMEGNINHDHPGLRRRMIQN